MAGGVVMMKMACLVLACMVMATHADISCMTVTTKLAPCLTYLTKGGEVPLPCCDGVRSLNDMAKTTPDHKAVCHCLMSAAKGLGSSLDAAAAAALPSKCGVSVPYPISASTDCDKIQ